MTRRASRRASTSRRSGRCCTTGRFPFNPKTWDFRVFGNVENEIKLNWEEFQKLEQKTAVTADMHCVTTWSRFDKKWEGVPCASREARAPEARAIRDRALGVRLHREHADRVACATTA